MSILVDDFICMTFYFFFFFFNDTATTEIYTLSLHDALPISSSGALCRQPRLPRMRLSRSRARAFLSSRSSWWVTTSASALQRSEEHTSELQSRLHLVCRLLLEKKKTIFLIRV